MIRHIYSKVQSSQLLSLKCIIMSIIISKMYNHVNNYFFTIMSKIISKMYNHVKNYL